MNQVIQLDGILNEVQNDEVQVYSTNTILQLSDQLDYAIDPTSFVEFPELIFIVRPNEIESTLAFGLTQLNQTIFAESVVSTVAFGDDKQISMQIVYTNAIDSTVEFDNPKLNFRVFANSALTQNDFGTSKLNTKIFANAVNPSALFGNLQTNMQIDDVPFPSIESTAIVSVPNVLKVIGPLSIAPTSSFGVASFIDNIHRILIFKDDNISKIGENDASVIAGGIRINPASVASETASSGDAILPEAPVGFLSVNINGVDYKIPYYNS
jgi:hypothetical protein